MPFESIEEFVDDAKHKMIQRDKNFTLLDITSPPAENHLDGEASRFAHHVYDSFDNETIVSLLQVASQEGCLVQELYLGFLPIDHEVAVALIQLFNDTTRSWNAFTIQRCLGRIWPSILSLIVSRANLRELRLYHNELGYDGFSALAMSLATNPVNLMELDIEEFISPMAAEAFSAGLKMNTTLKTLNLHECRFDLEAIPWIAEGVQGNRSIEVVYLDECQLTDDQCASMLSAILDHESLGRIVLDYNFCSTETLCQCAVMLRDNRLKNLKFLEIGWQESLVDPRVSPSLPVGILGGALKSNSMLHFLDLSGNRLDSAELASLMEGVKYSRIEHLGLESCRISDEDLELVLTHLPTSLLHLNLLENLFATDKSNDQLCKTATQHTTLERLEIDNDLDCWSQVCYHTRLNRGGRRLLTCGDTVPSGIWPIVLERVNKINWATYKNKKQAEELGYKEDAIYALLKGPAFCGR